MAFEKHKRKAIVKAFLKKLPLVSKIRNLRTRGSNESRYCYSVWLRHLILLNENDSFRPKKIAELGPGDSIGVGLAALLTGAEVLYAFDVNNTIDINQNLNILDDLVKLFTEKASIPDKKEYPYLSPEIQEYSFPAHLFDDKVLFESMNPDRIEAIRNEILQLNKNNFNGKYIKYKAPWDTNELVEKGSIDLIISQAVMEHVLNLELTYKTSKDWLKKTGKMSHQIDFKCHGTSTKWNGHWFYEEKEWQFVNDLEGPAINRATYKKHIDILNSLGFTIEMKKLIKNERGFNYNEFQSTFPNTLISEDEFTTSGMFIIAKK